MTGDDLVEVEDLVRQYNHLLAKSEPIDEVVKLLDRTYGEQFRNVVNEFDSVADFAERSGHDVSLMSKFRECLPRDKVDEKLFVFHYRAMLFGINSGTRFGQSKLKSTSGYVTAVGVVAIILFLFSEFLIQPQMMEVFDTFKAPPPEGWAAIHAFTLILLPIVVAWLALTHWLLGKSGDINRYFILATGSRRIPFIQRIGEAFKTNLITSFVRYAGSLDIRDREAIDSVRQAIAITYNERPLDANKVVLDRVVSNLLTADQLQTFIAELSFWENQAREEVEIQIRELATTLEALHMSLLGLFVGSIIIQMYLWVFSMGGALG